MKFQRIKIKEVKKEEKMIMEMENKEHVSRDYLSGRDRIVEKYSFRRSLASTIATILSAGSFIYPIVETIQTQGKAYSPEEIFTIGSVATTANVLAYLGFNKINQKRKKKEIHRYNVKEGITID